MSRDIFVTQFRSKAVLSLSEAALFLGVCRWTMRRIANDYRIPWLAMGRGGSRNARKGFYVPDLIKWIETNKIVRPTDHVRRMDGRTRLLRRVSGGVRREV